VEQAMNEWIPVLAAFTGAVVAGLISYRAAATRFSKEERAEKRAIFLEKLEETHEVARSIRLSYKRSYANTRMLLLTSKSEAESGNIVEIDRLLMLVGFYLPEILPAVDALEKSREQFGATIANSIVAITQPEAPRKELIHSLDSQYQQLDTACNDLLKAITATAQKYLKSLRTA
jgi:hypothetical protein